MNNKKLVIPIIATSIMLGTVIGTCLSMIAITNENARRLQEQSDLELYKMKQQTKALANFHVIDLDKEEL